MSRNTPKARQPFTIILITLVVALAIVLCGALIFLFTMLNQDAPVLTVEAGSPFPSAAAFFPESKQDVIYLSGTDAVAMDKPGRYPLTLSKGALKYDAVLQVEDTVAPTATVTDVTVFDN